MFLKTAELKKMMKSALKSAGLYVGNIAGNYPVYGSTWGLSTDTEYASNKFKAALTELIGDIPEPGECYRYYMQDKDVAQDTCVDYPNAYGAWKEAKTMQQDFRLTLFPGPMNLRYTRYIVI